MLKDWLKIEDVEVDDSLEEKSQIKEYIAGTVLLLLLLSVPTTFVTGWPWVSLWNDIRTYNFALSIKRLPTPSGNRVLTWKSRFGVLWGGGNHCDVEAMVLLQAKATPRQMVNAMKKPREIHFPFQGVSTAPFEKLRLYLWKDGRFWRVREKRGKVVVGKPDTEDIYDVDVLKQFVKSAPHPERKRYLIYGADQTYGGVRYWDRRCY